MECEERGELEQTSVRCWIFMGEDELLRKVFRSSYRCGLCSTSWVSCLLHWRMPGLVSVSHCSFQGEVWMLSWCFRTSGFTPVAGIGPSKGVREMSGIWELLESPQKKAVSSWECESFPVHCLGSVGFALDIQFWRFGFFGSWNFFMVCINCVLFAILGQAGIWCSLENVF